MTPATLDALRDPACYPHGVDRIELRETHISWVLLTGQVAYKIKKPVKLKFLDFSSLEQRRHYCEEELRLNRRFAPAIYLDVVTITGTTEAPRIGGEGAVLDYAVKLRQFAAADELASLLQHDAVEAPDLAALGENVARVQAASPSVDTTTAYGLPGATLKALEISMDQLVELVSDTERTRLETIRQQCRALSTTLEPLLRDRRAAGKVHECHGDLHIGNVVEVDGLLTPFDCLEFDPALRWLDILSDTAFLTMDLLAHQRPRLAYAFLNAWLETGGDYEGLPLYRYFSLFRALVRAMAERLRQPPGDHERYTQLLDRYLSTDARPPRLVITCGLSGSGKTWLSTQLLAEMPGIRIRSDVERKRLAGLDATASSHSQPGPGIYTKDYTERTYARLEDCAAIVLRAGESVIIDAACLRRTERERFVAIAHALSASAHIVHCAAPTDVLRQRINARQAKGGDASEATAAVLDQQLDWWEPLSPAEQAIALEVDTSQPASVAAALQQLGTTPGRPWRGD